MAQIKKSCISQPITIIFWNTSDNSALTKKLNLRVNCAKLMKGLRKATIFHYVLKVEGSSE